MANIIRLLGFSSVLLYFYTLYEVWHIFGFWRIVATTLVSIVGAVIIQFYGTGRSEKDGAVIFNPKEWPKFLGILVYIAVGYYLYDFLEKKQNLTAWEYYFGLIYLGLCSLLPILMALFKLIRDRNDYVKFADGIISYKDNSRYESFQIQNIKSCIKSGKDLELTFKDETSHTIPTSAMNFNARDLIALMAEINGHIAIDEVKEEVNWEDPKSEE